MKQNFSQQNIPILKNTKEEMTNSQNFNSALNLNELKQEILERESELDAAKLHAEMALKVLLDKTKDFNELEENMLKIPVNEKTDTSYELLISMKSVLKDKLPEASARYSKASQKEWKASEDLKKAKLALNKLKSNQCGTQKNSRYQDPEDYEKKISLKVLKATQKGTNFLENAHQEKLAIYQDEKHYETLAEIINNSIQDEDLKNDPKLAKALDTLNEIREKNDTRAEYFLEMKEKALEAFTTALKLKEMLSPENRKLMLQELQQLTPSIQMNQTQMTTPKRKILPRRQVLTQQYEDTQNFMKSPMHVEEKQLTPLQYQVLPHRRVRMVAPERSFVSPPFPMVQKTQISKVQVSPSMKSEMEVL